MYWEFKNKFKLVLILWVSNVCWLVSFIGCDFKNRWLFRTRLRSHYGKITWTNCSAHQSFNSQSKASPLVGIWSIENKMCHNSAIWMKTTELCVLSTVLFQFWLLYKQYVVMVNPRLKSCDLKMSWFHLPSLCFSLATFTNRTWLMPLLTVLNAVLLK